MTIHRENVQIIRALADKVAHERNDTVEQLLGRLTGIEAELADAWGGPSQIAFHESYGDWIEQLRKYSSTLNNVHQYLASAAQNFEDLDAAAATARGAATPG
jgi:WXG100 family type VII secretion target